MERICAADNAHKTREVGRVLFRRKFGLDTELACKLVSKLENINVAVARGKRVIQELLEVVSLPFATPRSDAARWAMWRRTIGAFRASWWLLTAMLLKQQQLPQPSRVAWGGSGKKECVCAFFGDGLSSATIWAR